MGLTRCYKAAVFYILFCYYPLSVFLAQTILLSVVSRFIQEGHCDLLLFTTFIVYQIWA